MLYDENVSESQEEEEEESEEEIVRKKSKSKKSSKSKEKKSKSSSKSKKSRAIIEDDEEDEDEEPTVKSLVNPAAALVDEDDDDDDDEEDEDEEAAEGEFNGFIDDNEGAVDEDEEEDSDNKKQSDADSDSHSHGRKKKKKKKDKKLHKKKKKKNIENSDSNQSSEQSSDNDSELSEDDIDLIKDNLAVEDLEEIGIANKKRRRIRLASESSEEEKVKSDAKELKKHKKPFKSPSKKHKSNRQENEFDDSDVEEPMENDEDESGGDEDQNQERRSSMNHDEGGNGESDEGSFIVDDSDQEADEETKEARRIEKERNKKNKLVYNDEAQQEALDIFGVNAEELGAQSDQDEDDDEEYDEDEEDMEEEYDEDEEKDEEDDDYTQKSVKKRQKQQRLKVMHKMEDIFEPQELVKNLLTEYDQQIKIEDKPERFMLRTLPITVEPEDFELENEARWIFNQAFQGRKTISNQEYQEPKQDDKYEVGNTIPSPVIQKIKDVLNFLRNEFLEVPFIAFYRKEYLNTDHERFNPQTDLSINDLWKIYEMNEKYCQLKIRKENFIKLLERMQSFQTEVLRELKMKRYIKTGNNYGEEEGDENYAEEEEDIEVAQKIDSTRVLDEADLERVRNVQSNEEFLDCYQHFHLHYGCDLISMKEYERAHKRLMDRKARRLASKGTKKVINEAGEEIEVPNDDDDENENDYDDMDDEEQPAFIKYASRKDRFHHCRSAGLTSLANKFGLTCEQFGENVASDYQVNDVEQCAIEPNMLAMDYVREPNFQNVDQVLSAVKYMVTIQLAKDPVVRNTIRELYMQNVCINVRPVAPRGIKDIDENHSCFAFKYLSMKECSKLERDDYLKLAQAEQDKLLTITFVTRNVSKQVVTAVAAAPPKPVSTGDDWDDDDDGTAPTATPVPTSVPTLQTSSMSIIDKLKSYFQKDEFSYNVQQWNAIRAEVIEEMCTKFLFPDFENECRSKLLREAKTYVFTQCAASLGSILEKAPYKSNHPSEVVNSMDLEDSGLSVISIAYTNNEDGNEGPKSASVACASMINGNGELEEFIGIRNLNVKLYRDKESGDYAVPNGFMSEQKSEKIEDLEKLEEFIINKRPDLICLSAEDKDALMVMEDIKTVLKKVGEKQTQLSDIPIEFVSVEMSKLFISSKVCEQELGKDLPNIVKTSISLARCIQDPLLAYSQLCNLDRDILAMKLHPMQQTIISNSGGRTSDDSSELLRLLEIEFINRVNEVGVDLNRCNIASHTSHCLQFVSGLGPRKAQHIMKVLRHQRAELMSELPPDKQTKTYPVATNRLFLVTKCTLGRRVFINCAGFIRFDVDNISREIEEDQENDYEKHTEILDSTRIHPEHYEWARKMAIDALDVEDSEDSNSAHALKEVIENPKTLKELDLDAFAKELNRTGYGVKNKTLFDIRSELTERYRDMRKPYEPINEEDLFYLLINESRSTFYAGKLILARVIGIARKKPTRQKLDESNPIKDDNTCLWSCEFCKRNDFTELGQVWSHLDTNECPGPPVGARAMLDNGCSAFLPLKFLSDKRVENPDERIKPGMTIHARITRIDPIRFSVELTSRTSDLRDEEDKWKPQKDERYDYQTEKEDKNKIDEKKRKEEHKQHYVKRIIAHPQFKNIGYSQAVALLQDMELGDCIIRPSSKGSNHLTLTWKITKNCYQHVDILEDKKQNEFSLGKRLIIEGEDFEDLDEILARYIGNLTNHVREIMTHKNYREGDQINVQFSQPGQQNSQDMNAVNVENIERALLDEREKNKSKIPYMFTCCVNLPGRFMLSYMVKLKLRNEYIKITQEGFKFREKIFNSFNELIAWFKMHFMDPLPVRPPPPPTQEKISSQMSNMSMNNSHRTPAYPPPNKTPSHNSNNNTAFDSIINNSMSQPAEYSTNNPMDNSYSAPTRKYGGDYDRGDNRGDRDNRGGRGGRGGFRGGNRGGRGGYDNNRGDYNRENGNYGNRENDSASSYRGGGSRGDYRGGGRGGRDGGYHNNDNSSFSSEPRRGRGGGVRASRFTDNTDLNTSSQNSYSNSQPSNHSQPKPAGDDDWDDDGPSSAPIQANPRPASQQSNRFNNNKTPSYEPASKTPNYAPNKTPSHVTGGDDDWDDDGPARAPMQATTPNRFNNKKTPSHDIDSQQPRHTPNRFNNNKTPSHETDWNSQRSNQSNNSSQRFNNNKTPSYAPPAADNDNWDDDNTPAPKQVSQSYNYNNNNRNGSDNNNRSSYNNNNNSNNYNRSDNYNNNKSKSPGGGYNRYDKNNESSQPPRSQPQSNNDNDDWDDEPVTQRKPQQTTQSPAPKPYSQPPQPQQQKPIPQPPQPQQQKPIPQPTTSANKYADDDDWDA